MCDTHNTRLVVQRFQVLTLFRMGRESKVKNVQKVLSIFALSVLFSSTVLVSVGNAETKPLPNPNEGFDKLIEGEIMVLEELDPFFVLLEELPMEIAEAGIVESVEWLNINKGEEFDGAEFVADGENLKTVELNDGVIETYGWGFACINSVIIALAANLIPWAKILKVKKAAKLVGGLNTVVKNTIRAYKHQRNLGYSKKNAMKRAVDVVGRTFPADTKQAFIDVFSLGGVMGNCFS